jgi:hypothetical protein
VRSHRLLTLLAAIVALPAAALTGCSSVTSSSGAPPTVICGKTIWKAAAGASVQDVSHGGSVTYVSAGDYVFLRVSRSCTTGVAVTIDPSDAAQILTTAPSKDGRAAAVVIAPHQHKFTVDLTSPGGPSYIVRVNVPRLPSTSSSSPSPSGS